MSAQFRIYAAPSRNVLWRGSVARNSSHPAKFQRRAITTNDSVAVPPRQVMGDGRLLDTATRAFFEPRFGQDFSAVSIPAIRPASVGVQVQRQAILMGAQPAASTERRDGADEGSARTRGADACTQPTGVRLVSTHQVQVPDYLTGGGSAGICAVMEALPTGSTLCLESIHEEVTLASGATCPDSLFEGGLCRGGSTFTPGRNQVAACRSIEIPATGFTDRHTAQVRGVSVLHDSTRNPRSLISCSFICNQRYYTLAGTTEHTIGRFQIHYQVRRGTRDGHDVTDVTATKTVQPSSPRR